MKTRLIRIGNSQGVRIPKVYLEQTGLSAEVELEVQAGEIVIRSTHPPRHGWAKAFQTMADRQDDDLLDSVTKPASAWDETEWQW